MKLKINLLLLFFIVLLARCSTPDSTTIIYLVRHAEKQLPPNDSLAMGASKWEDPDLTEAGFDRALRLADLLEDKSIKVIYSTPYQRNLHTVAPLSQRLAIDPKLYVWKNWQPVIQQIDKLNGTALVCGHGDILLPMIEALGAERPQAVLEDQEYDKLFKITKQKSSVKVETIVF